MILPRQQSLVVSDPISTETVDGRQAAYTCNISCGIGTASGIAVGIIVILALWTWYWLRRPARDSPEEHAAEASRTEFLLGKHHTARIKPDFATVPIIWAKRASIAIKHAMLPSHPVTDAFDPQKLVTRDSCDSESHLVKHIAPIASVQRYGLFATPTHGSLPSIDNTLVPPPLSVQSRRGTVETRLVYDERWSIDRSRRIRQAPWEDETFVFSQKAFGNRAGAPISLPLAPVHLGSASPTREYHHDPGRNTLRKSRPPPPIGRRTRKELCTGVPF